MEVVTRAKETGVTIALAESMTGGMVSSALTAIPGASQVLYGSWICYTDSFKNEVCGVSKTLLERDGAVSPEVTKALAFNIKNLSNADIALSITGLAGPAGPSETSSISGDRNPIGRVYFGLNYRDVLLVKQADFKGDRNEVRHQAVNEALDLLLQTVELLNC